MGILIGVLILILIRVVKASERVSWAAKVWG